MKLKNKWEEQQRQRRDVSGTGTLEYEQRDGGERKGKEVQLGFGLFACCNLHTL